MSAPSIYSYFDSKNALYDAMYADGYRALIAMGPPRAAKDLRATVRNGARWYVDFALADPVRHQLLGERTIPGFEPSAESYALAQQAYDISFAPLRALADVAQEDLDLITAIVTGLINQQFANDPGGSRWIRLLDDAVDLVLPRLEKKKRQATPTRRRRSAQKGTA